MKARHVFCAGEVKDGEGSVWGHYRWFISACLLSREVVIVAFAWVASGGKELRMVGTEEVGSNSRLTLIDLESLSQRQLPLIFSGNPPQSGERVMITLILVDIKAMKEVYYKLIQRINFKHNK